MHRARPFPRALVGAVVVMLTLTGCRTAVTPQAAPAGSTTSTASGVGRPPVVGSGVELVAATSTSASTTTSTTRPATTPATAPAAPASPGTFTETFDGDPPRPTPLDSPRWH